MNPHLRLVSATLALALPACTSVVTDSPAYGKETAFLRKHTPIIELKSGGQRVAIAPVWQGRVMTSTNGGSPGASHGWINRKLVQQGVLPEGKRGELENHIHAFGGEERLWLGPEGGPFSLFFAPGAEQVFANWKTPAVFDTDPFDLVARSPRHAIFHKETTLKNSAGTHLHVGIGRRIDLLDATATEAITGPLPRSVNRVVYTSANTVTNLGNTTWDRRTGMPSIWMLGMLNPSDTTVIYVPFRPGSIARLGPRVITNYFGAIPPDRIKITDKGVFFKGDGRYRAKLGIPAPRALPASGSYDPVTGTLTLLVCDLPADRARRDYVCSLWGNQDKPFNGDVINSYNDGPSEPGKPPLGPFYELESSSPALALAPNQSYTHKQTTLHLSGPPADLDAVSRKVLGVPLADITGAFR